MGKYKNAIFEAVELKFYRSFVLSMCLFNLNGNYMLRKYGVYIHNFTQK